VASRGLLRPCLHKVTDRFVGDQKISRLGIWLWRGGLRWVCLGGWSRWPHIGRFGLVLGVVDDLGGGKEMY